MELIGKDKLIETLEQIPCWECDGACIDECYSCIMERVVDAPVVDAVDVVRCKDCKCWGNELNWGGRRRGVCDFYEILTDADGYCYRSVRKEVQE